VSGGRWCSAPWAELSEPELRLTFDPNLECPEVLRFGEGGKVAELALPEVAGVLLYWGWRDAKYGGPFGTARLRIEMPGDWCDGRVGAVAFGRPLMHQLAGVERGERVRITRLVDHELVDGHVVENYRVEVWKDDNAD